MTTTRLVLVVDDDKFQLEFIGGMLRELGVEEVLTAANGKQGLALFDSLEQKPDLLLCDLQMPEMDGIEFLRNMAGRNYQGIISVISGMETDLLKAAEKLARAYGLNMSQSLGKEINRETLQNLLSMNELGRPRQVANAQEETPITLEELKSGLKENLIEVYFQPKVAVAERRMLGVECLARWRHPERGLLGPNTFISLAEQHGLIDELTLIVLRKAVNYAAEWNLQGGDCKVAVNISADNLNHLDLPQVIEQIVHDAGIDSQQIVLEITESGLMKDFNLSLDILTRLRLKGFSLSVDDYGTGYSNMEKLKKLPFSELKVDRAFVCGAASDPTTRTILESSVRLGKTLGMNLVAEGVETREDWDMVARLGCDEAQGYFIARPMPASEVCTWKREWENMPDTDIETCMRNNDVPRNSDLPCILNVDDNIMMQKLAEDMLGGSFQILTAQSGEACLELLQNTRADLILLDVEMPGIDGYETCRRIKENSDIADIPVIFLSGHDHIENRLRGYEVGGEDYIVKPFDPVELESKVRNLLRLCRERDQHKEMADYASSAAMTAMTSLGELGALIETMKRFNVCNTFTALADATIVGLSLYGLQGAVQIRTATETLTRNEEGEATPLVASVIKHMALMERITSFKSRMCITYENISLLVNTMPEEDPDRYGRLRDHLAMLAEGANMRVQAIILGNTLNRVVENLTDTLAKIDTAQRQNKTRISIGLNALNDDIDRAYISLGLTDAQEHFLSEVIRDGIDNILHGESDSLDVQDKLSSLIRELNELNNCDSSPIAP